MEDSRVGRLWRVRRGYCTGVCICSYRTLCIHAAMDFSDWPHVNMVDFSGFTYGDMVLQIFFCLRKDFNCGKLLVLMEFQVDVCRVIIIMVCMMGGRRVFGW